MFVGNDGNRVPEKFISLVEHFKDESFVAISNLKEFSSFTAPNFELYSELINGNKLSDMELKEIYKTSKLVVIPLKESFSALWTKRSAPINVNGFASCNN